MSDLVHSPAPGVGVCAKAMAPESGDQSNSCTWSGVFVRRRGVRFPWLSASAGTIQRLWFLGFSSITRKSRFSFFSFSSSGSRLRGCGGLAFLATLRSVQSYRTARSRAEEMIEWIRRIVAGFIGLHTHRKSNTLDSRHLG